MFNNVRRLSGQLFVYGSADVAVLGINFILLPLYTRVLSPAEYGALALLLHSRGGLQRLEDDGRAAAGRLHLLQQLLEHGRVAKQRLDH